LCKCGCGQKVAITNKYKPQKFILGHQVQTRTKEEWGKVYKKYVEGLPFCKCGCKNKVLPRYKTLEKFIQGKGSKTGIPKYINGHDKQPIFSKYHFTASSQEKQAIIGTCLGDSCLGLPHGRSKNFRLSSTHGLCQKEWAEYKAIFLQRYDIKLRTVKNGGYGELSVKSWSSCLPAITAIASELYKNGKKRIRYEILDSLGAIGLAWWICDDGSNSLGCISLHTEGWSYSENRIVWRWFNKQGFCCKIQKCNKKDKKYYCIRFNTEGSKRLSKYIRKYIPKCMEYKLDNYQEYKKRKKAKSL
jgi:hypothetical protein